MRQLKKVTIVFFALIFSVNAYSESAKYPRDYLAAHPEFLKQFPTVQTIDETALGEIELDRAYWRFQACHYLRLIFVQMLGKREFKPDTWTSAEQKINNRYRECVTNTRKQSKVNGWKMSADTSLRLINTSVIARAYLPVFFDWHEAQGDQNRTYDREPRSNEADYAGSVLLAGMGEATFVIFVLCAAGIALYVCVMILKSIFTHKSRKIKKSQAARKARIDAVFAQFGETKEKRRHKILEELQKDDAVITYQGDFKRKDPKIGRLNAGLYNFEFRNFTIQRPLATMPASVRAPILALYLFYNDEFIDDRYFENHLLGLLYADGQGQPDSYDDARMIKPGQPTKQFVGAPGHEVWAAMLREHFYTAQHAYENIRMKFAEVKKEHRDHQVVMALVALGF